MFLVSRVVSTNNGLLKINIAWNSDRTGPKVCQSHIQL
jgi:hypothetical protein